MRIASLLQRREPFLSLEFFPPKDRADWPGFFQAVDQLKQLGPLFCSVTYGAGGGTQGNSLEIVSRMKRECGVEPLAHLTCVHADKDRIRDFLRSLTSAGIENILALRGDPPRGETVFSAQSEDFQHGSDLVSFVRREFPSFSIGVAGYPEKHPQASDSAQNLAYLKQKVDCGGDFVITQLFFDNDLYFDFVKRARMLGINVPIIPGILPVRDLAALKRMTAFCGASVPVAFLRDLEAAQAKDGAAGVRAVGLAYAREQVQNLLDRGAPGVHLYTLNKVETCQSIWRACRPAQQK